MRIGLYITTSWPYKSPARLDSISLPFAACFNKLFELRLNTLYKPKNCQNETVYSDLEPTDTLSRVSLRSYERADEVSSHRAFPTNRLLVAQATDKALSNEFVLVAFTLLKRMAISNDLDEAYN